MLDLVKTLKKKKISYYKNYKDVLKLQNLDAVFVTLPNYLASQVTIDFLKKVFMFFVKNHQEEIQTI